MKFLKTYRLLLFMMCVFQAFSASASDNYNTQELDSLLNDSKNRVYEKPDESIELGLSVFENVDNPIKLRTRALLLVSLGYTSKRDYKKALDYIIKANEFYGELDDTKLKLEILFMSGIIYQQLKIFDKSIEFMEKIERIALTTTGRDSLGRFLASSYLVKGFIYKDNLNCDIALDFFNRGIKEYERLKNINNNTNTSIAYYNKGNCFILLSEYENAKNSFNKSMAFAKLENASSLISFAQKGLAEVYTLEGQYLEAISLLQSALEQSKNVGDIILNLGIYKGLFENYLALNQWNEYQKYYELFLKTQLEIKISERNSVSDSITENYKILNNELNSIQKQINNKIKWLIFIIIVFVLIVLFSRRKNIKTLKLLRKKVDSFQNIKPSLK